MSSGSSEDDLRVDNANHDQEDGEEPEDQDEDGIVNDFGVLAEVVLARTPGTYPRVLNTLCHCIYPNYLVRRYPKNVHLLAHALQVPLLPSLVRYFLYDQLSPNAPQSGAEAGLDACPEFDGNITVFPSAIAEAMDIVLPVTQFTESENVACLPIHRIFRGARFGDCHTIHRNQLVYIIFLHYQGM